MTLTLALLIGCTRPPEGPSAPRPEPEHTAAPTVPTPTPTADTGTVAPPPGPLVVLVIGDGMGPAHLDAAAAYRNGAPGTLAIQTLPSQGALRTASLSGITDSAAAGTLMSAGVHTLDGRIALDRWGVPVETLLDLARARGWSTGVVTTARLPHATPAAFTAHHLDRDAELEIAPQQIGAADLLLGGGQGWFLPADDPRSERTDDGLLQAMADAGIAWVEDAEQLASTPLPLIGAFAPSHLPYVGDRPPGEPSLPELVQVALDKLGADPDGTLLVVEGARIDHASHDNHLERAILETLELDDTVALLRDALAPRQGLLVVTADHDCGGLAGIVPRGAGTLPAATWRWGNHTNAPVTVSAVGPGSDDLQGVDADHRLVHAVLARAIDGRGLELPPVLVPDGQLLDLGHRVAEQQVVSSLGDDQARLSALSIDADDFGLAVGIEGVFPWQTHAVIVLVDVDDGASTGLNSFAGQLSDLDTPADAALSRLRVQAPVGVGYDVAVVSVGGMETPYMPPLRGVRGLGPPWGTGAELGVLAGAVDYAVETRTTPSAPLSVRYGEGFEAYVPWYGLWPALQGDVPPGTVIGVTALLVSADGTTLTDQVLPSLPAGSPPLAPGAALPGVVRLAIDTDGDGIPGPVELR